MNVIARRYENASAETHRSLRFRVNVSQTSKGLKSWDSTVDGQGYTKEEVLEFSDALVAELEMRYPPELA